MSSGKTALQVAASRNNLNAVEYLIERGASVDLYKTKEHGHPASWWPPILHAVFRGNIPMVKALLEARANPDAVYDHGYTPLSVAAEYHDSAELAELLISHGARTDMTTWDRWNPLPIAAARQSIYFLRILLERGANPNAKTYGRTVLSRHCGAKVDGGCPRADIIRLLLEAGAEVEAKDDWGRTPLAVASRQKGNSGIASLLLEFKADINTKDTWGLTPLSIALHYGCDETAKMLQDAGAILQEHEWPDDASIVPEWDLEWKSGIHVSWSESWTSGIDEAQG